MYNALEQNLQNHPATAKNNKNIAINFLFQIFNRNILKMSINPVDIYAPSDDDLQRLLLCEVHLGARKLVKTMEPYVFKRQDAGNYIIDLGWTWQKIQLAARMLAAVERPEDICVVASSEYAQRAAMKFSKYTNATSITSRFTPGCLTNQEQKRFIEPRVVIIADPQADHQAIRETSYVNIPVISLCNTDSPTRFVDCAIPCNNRSKNAIALLFWLLAREVLRMRSELSREEDFVLVDLFIYRDPDAVIEPEQTAEETAEEGEVEGWGQDDANWSAEATAANTWEGPENTWEATEDTAWTTEA
ncbi:hypothetical protein PCE1_004773 [Barthelona sp. PCE]